MRDRASSRRVPLGRVPLYIVLSSPVCTPPNFLGNQLILLFYSLTCATQHLAGCARTIMPNKYYKWQGHSGLCAVCGVFESVTGYTLKLTSHVNGKLNRTVHFRVAVGSRKSKRNSD